MTAALLIPALALTPTLTPAPVSVVATGVAA